MSEKSTNDRLTRLKLIHDIAVEMNKSRTTDELLELILAEAIRITHASSGSVALINEKDQRLDIAAFKGLNDDITRRTRLRIGEGVTGWVAQKCKPRLVNNTRTDPYYIKVRNDLMSELAVPVMSEDRFIGVISVDSTKMNAFKDEDQELMMMLAELAGQIFAKDRIKEMLEIKVKNQETLIVALETLEEKAGLNEIFNLLMEKLSEKMGIIRGMIVLFDPNEPSALRITAGYRLSEDAVKKGIYAPGEGIIGQAVLSGKTIAVEDISREPRFLNKMKIMRSAMGQMSFIVSPIRVERRVVGALALEKKFDTDYSFADTTQTVTLLTTILSNKVRNYLEQQKRTAELIGENNELKKALRVEQGQKSIIGKDVKMLKVLEQINLAAGTFASVLITGETGTGKELVAKALHSLSDRRDRGFISVNCSAIPENLLETELFGHTRGAFTGAAAARKGKFELADKGTIFLDEIGDMPLHLQAKILRALQEKEIQPLGSEKTIKVDIRIVAASNRDLETMIKEGKFRTDLYYRLNVINIHLPALRERRDDIPLLTDFFLKRFNVMYGKKISGLDEKTSQLFTRYEWPGNIRELENALERCVILARENIIEAQLLPASLKGGPGPEASTPEHSLKNWIKEELLKTGEEKIYSKVGGKFEKLLIEELLIRNNWNKSKTADQLGLNRNTLKAKIREYGIS
jgi:Nif-specific regulatory protein